MKLRPKGSEPTRIVRTRVNVTTDKERVEPVYAAPPVKTKKVEAELKARFEEISARHKEMFTSIALTYLSLMSAVDQVSELLRESAVSDFSLIESDYKKMVEEKLDAAIAYFVAKECFTAAKATEEDMSAILTKAIQQPKSIGMIGSLPRQQHTSNTSVDPAREAIGLFLSEMKDKLTVQSKPEKPFGEMRRAPRRPIDTIRSRRDK